MRTPYALYTFTEHVSGAGTENGTERAQKPDERSGRSRERERAKSAAHNPLKHND